MSTDTNKGSWSLGTLIAVIGTAATVIGTAAAVLTLPESRKFLNLEESEALGLEALSGQYSGEISYGGQTSRAPMALDIDVNKSGKVSCIFRGPQGDAPLNGETDGNSRIFCVFRRSSLAMRISTRCA